MIINENKIRELQCLAEKHHVREMILFGSVVDNPETAHDVDIGVGGVPPDHFFELYGDLLDSFHIEVDLVDLDRKSRFTELVRKTGKRIYARA